MGTLLNWHATPRRRQLEQVSTPASEVASHRTWEIICVSLVVAWSASAESAVPSCACTRRRLWIPWIAFAARSGPRSSGRGLDRLRLADSV